MIKLILIAGFLGAGKTTLLQSVLDSYKDEKVGVIINEFGEVNIDAALVRKEGIEMMELSNGSIFCACIKDRFVESLIAMSGQDISCLFIEASGLADPANMGRILESVKPRLLSPYDYRGSVCVVDAETYLELSDILPALAGQVEYSGGILINKADLADSQKIEAVSRALSLQNPDAGQFVTSYCRMDMRTLVDGLEPVEKEDRDTTNTVESRPKTFIIKSAAPVDLEALEGFLETLAPQAYRIKGFAHTKDGVKEVSAVRERIRVSPWDAEVPAMELVVISAVGIRMMSLIAAALNRKGIKGKLVL